MNIFILYLILINLIGFLLMGRDKAKAIKGDFRISEKNLFMLAIVFGSAGILIGMYTFRHKTKHITFKIGIPTLLILNIICIYIFLHFFWT